MVGHLSQAWAWNSSRRTHGKPTWIFGWRTGGIGATAQSTFLMPESLTSDWSRVGVGALLVDCTVVGRGALLLRWASSRAHVMLDGIRMKLTHFPAFKSSRSALVPRENCIGMCLNVRQALSILQRMFSSTRFDASIVSVRGCRPTAYLDPPTTCQCLSASLSAPIPRHQLPRPTHHHRAKENFHLRPRHLLSFSSFLLHIEQRKTINVHVPLTLTMARGSGLTALDAHDCNYTGD